MNIVRQRNILKRINIFHFTNTTKGEIDIMERL